MSDVTAVLASIPAGKEYDVLRWTIARVAKQFPGVSFAPKRVSDWVAEIEGGKGRNANQIRSDILTHMVGEDLIMRTYDIGAEEAAKVISGEVSMSSYGDVDPVSGQTLNNIPGTPEVWKVGGKTLLVYIVPGTEDDPVYMSWEVPSGSDLEEFFGPGQTPKYDREMSEGAYANMGVLDFGSTTELANRSEEPFAGWLRELETQAITQPWILDEDYQALMAQAVLEGRTLTDAEIATTRWWRENNLEERAWMIKFHGDPLAAEQEMADKQRQVRDLLVAAGAGTGTSEEIINYMAGQWAMGHWAESKLHDQIRAITDKSSGIAVDSGLNEIGGVGDIGQTINEEDTVRSLLHTWLGPAFGEWSDDEIARVAGEMRNDPEAEERFVEQLKDQRMVMLPNHTDREMSYQAIANVWKQWWMGQWGQTPDEKDPLFMQVLQSNDINENSSTMRKEGLERGIGKVESDLSNFGAAIGGSPRGTA